MPSTSLRSTVYHVSTFLRKWLVHHTISTPVDKVRVVQCELGSCVHLLVLSPRFNGGLLTSVQDVVNRLDTQHERMILVSDLFAQAH
jgi:hypothetical protein